MDGPVTILAGALRRKRAREEVQHKAPSSTDAARFVRLFDEHSQDPAVKQLVRDNLLSIDPLVLKEGACFNDAYVVLLELSIARETMRNVMQVRACDELRARLAPLESGNNGAVTLHGMIVKLEEEKKMLAEKLTREEQRNGALVYRAEQQAVMIGRAHAEDTAARREQIVRAINDGTLALSKALQERLPPDLLDTTDVLDVIVQHVDGMRVAVGQFLH